MSTTWFTADQHFYHRHVIKYCDRPFRDLNEMHSVLIEKHNEVVQEDDHVYMLGDLAMLGSSQYDKLASIVRRLNGIKHLILGNHDEHKPFAYVKMGFATVHTAVKVEEFWCMHDPAGSEIVKNELVLCGHVHTLFTRQRNCLNIGVDVCNFRPVSLGEVKLYFTMTNKEIM